jgi:hypothetical protein
MTHEEMKEKAFRILRSNMENIHILDEELRRNIENTSESVLMAFIEEYEEFI